MRQWNLHSPTTHGHALGGLIGLMGQQNFEAQFLSHLQEVVPAASYAIYRTGGQCVPTRFMSASLGVADHTHACWKAYLSGPQKQDQTLAGPALAIGDAMLCHITDQEIPKRHKALVYEPHGMKERLSVIQQEAASVFAINFYRHEHQRPFSEAHLSDLAALAPLLLTLVQKQIALVTPQAQNPVRHVGHWMEKLKARHPTLTDRELEVCARLLTGMTQDGIASDLGLSLATVKTYRNRAFDRLGIHFKSQLFSLFLH
jgi:DNA-binding CsgD family transcriptional regulator